MLFEKIKQINEPFPIFSVLSINSIIFMPTKSDITDGELVQQYLAGDTNALTILVKRFHKMFCDHAYYVVKDADVAKDIAQDTWKLIIAKVAALQQPERFKYWALRIVHRKAIDWTRSVSKQSQEKNDYKLTKSIRELPTEDTSHVKEQLRKAIQELSFQHQQVIRLFYTEKYSLKEVAATLQISVGTAKSRLFHAREHLKKQLKK